MPKFVGQHEVAGGVRALQFHMHLSTGSGPAPDRHRLALLQDHVVTEDRRHPKFARVRGDTGEQHGESKHET